MSESCTKDSMFPSSSTTIWPLSSFIEDVVFGGIRRARWDFPGGPVVKIHTPNTAGPGSVLDGELLRSSIPHAARCSQKTKMKKVPGSPGAQGRVEMCQDQYPVSKTQETMSQTAQSFNR